MLAVKEMLGGSLLDIICYPDIESGFILVRDDIDEVLV